MATPSSQSPYLQNASAAANFVDWAAAEAHRSMPFHIELDRLRHLAAGSKRGGYERTTGPLTGKSWTEISRLRALGAQPPQERPRVWKRTHLPTDDGLRHVRDYERGVRKVARNFLGLEAVAPRVHDLVGRTGYQLAPYIASAPRAPMGARASSLAAHMSGASWGSGATALRTVWRRARPKEDKSSDTFVL